MFEIMSSKSFYLIDLYDFQQLWRKFDVEIWKSKSDEMLARYSGILVQDDLLVARQTLEHFSSCLFTSMSSFGEIFGKVCPKDPRLWVKFIENSKIFDGDTKTTPRRDKIQAKDAGALPKTSRQQERPLSVKIPKDSMDFWISSTEIIIWRPFVYVFAAAAYSKIYLLQRLNRRTKSYQGKEIQNTAVFKMIYFLYQSDHTFIVAE